MSKQLFVIVSLLLCLAIACPAYADSPAWRCDGPYGGAMRSVASSPDFAHDQLLLASAEQGGLFRSTDGGETWQSVGGLVSSLTIASIVFSPSFAQDATVFLSSTQGGIFKSLDRGLNWSPWSDGLATFMATQVALSPQFATDQTAFAATDRGIYKTISAGKRWSSVGPTLPAFSVAVGQGQTALIVFGGTATGLYRSTDGGVVWEETSVQGLPITALSLSPDFAHDGTVLVGTLAGIYLSTDSGQTWQGPWIEEQVIHSVLCSPALAQDQTMLAGAASGLYASTDLGLNWQAVEAVDDVVHAMAAEAGADRLSIWAGTSYQGLLYAEDLASTWVTRHDGITGRALEAIEASPNFAVDATILAGGPDGLWQSEDDGQSWRMAPLSDAGVNAIRCSPNFGRNRTVYAANRGGVFVSFDRGYLWQPTTGALPALNVSDLVLNQLDDLWIATAEGGVFYSDDAGSTWQSRSTGLGSLSVTSLVWLGGADGQDRLIAGTWGRGTYYSEDGGRQWLAAGDGPDTPHIHSLDAATGFDGRIWSFCGSTAGVYHSGNQGQTWDLSGLMGLDIASVAMYPNYASRPNVYVGSHRDGVLRSLNGGVSWQPFNTDLGNLHVNALAVSVDDVGLPVVFAATQAGVWRHGGAQRTPEPPELYRLWLPRTSRLAMSAATTLEAAQSPPDLVADPPPLRPDR